MAQSILITGCSSGIGYASALALKKRGYKVFATARKDEALQKLKNAGLEAIKLDLTDKNSIQTAVAEVVSLTEGRLDALFNNAGYLQLGAFEDVSEELMRAQFETNVFGTMALIREVLPVMRKLGHGRIIQNSSILGIITIPFCSAYNASKFALEGFSLTLRQELRSTNIKLAILNPGPIKSDLRENAYQYYLQTLQNQNSVYREVYRELEVSYFKQKDSNLAGEPKLVIKNLIHALESKRPKIHYYVGFTAKLLAILHRLLPEKLLDLALARTR